MRSIHLLPKRPRPLALEFLFLIFNLQKLACAVALIFREIVLRFVFDFPSLWAPSVSVASWSSKSELEDSLSIRSR